MRPIFANSAWVSAPERFILQGGRWTQIPLRVRYGLVLHPNLGPILIDTGYTVQALDGRGRSAALRFYGAALRPRINDAEQPSNFLARFGLTPLDVRIVIVTHFHADHISGLSLFPNARFIADDISRDRVRKKSIWQNLRHGVFPELLPGDFDDRLDGLCTKAAKTQRFGFDMERDLLGDGSLLAVALPGHADGHFGILFATLARPLLYAVDAQWLLTAVMEDREPGIPGSLVAADAAAVSTTNRQLRRFIADGGDVLLCHDPAPTHYDFAPERETA